LCSLLVVAPLSSSSPAQGTMASGAVEAHPGTPHSSWWPPHTSQLPQWLQCPHPAQLTSHVTSWGLIAHGVVSIED
jgi:hypothetical protein